MFFPLTWHISQIIVDVLSLVMLDCVFNKSKCHWLLSDALNFDISICLKLREEFKISNYFDNFMEKDSIVVLEVGFLASNIRKKNLLMF
jgi:hypothetical protein